MSANLAAPIRLVQVARFEKDWPGPRRSEARRGRAMARANERGDAAPGVIAGYVGETPDAEFGAAFAMYEEVYARTDDYDRAVIESGLGPFNPDDPEPSPVIRWQLLACFPNPSPC